MAPKQRNTAARPVSPAPTASTTSTSATPQAPRTAPAAPLPPSTATVPKSPKSTATTSTGSSSSSSAGGLGGAPSWDKIVANVAQHYLDTTPQRTKLLDSFMAFLVVVGALQFAYCVLAGNYVRLSPSPPLLSSSGAGSTSSHAYLMRGKTEY